MTQHAGTAADGRAGAARPMTALAASARARWLYRMHRLLQKLSGGRAGLHVYLFCAQPVNALALNGVRDDAGTRIVPVLPGDPLLQSFPRPPAVLARRFASGATCHAALVKDQFAGHVWLASGHYDEDTVRCRYQLPGPAAVWDFDVYVAPRFRGTRVIARLWQAVGRVLHRGAIDWSFSRIDLFNKASVQAHEHLGARHLRSGIFLTLGPLQAALFTCPRRWVLTWGGNRAPVIEMPMPADAPSSRLHALPHPDPGSAARPAKRAAPPDEPTAMSGTQSGAAAVVLGLDSHGLAVARALADGGVTVYALEKDLNQPGVLSNRVRRVFPVQDYAAEHLIPDLLAARQALSQHAKVALLAINDRQVEAIARHLPELQSAYCIAWADLAAQILMLQDKNELQAVCERQGLLYPRSVTFHTVDDSAMAAGMHYPLIIKPVRPLSSFKTLLARDADELRLHLKAYGHDLPILCQEYVPGDDRQIYFGALMLDRGRVTGALAGRKIASYPPARGQTTIAETVDEPEVLRLTEQFFAGLGLSGPVSLELKRGPDGRYWVIEPTVGRTDFWAELCISAGFNQPLMEYQLAIGQPLQAPPALADRLWFDTERDPMAWLALSRSAKSLRPMGKKPAFPYFGHRDGRPAMRSVRKLTRLAFQRLIGASAASLPN